MTCRERTVHLLGFPQRPELAPSGKATKAPPSATPIHHAEHCGSEREADLSGLTSRPKEPGISGSDRAKAIGEDCALSCTTNDRPYRTAGIGFLTPATGEDITASGHLPTLLCRAPWRLQPSGVWAASSPSSRKYCPLVEEAPNMGVPAADGRGLVGLADDSVLPQRCRVGEPTL